MFSKQLIQATLRNNEDQTATPLVTEVESETGPGYFNPYRYLQPDEKNIFSNSLPHSAMPSAEKIIISSPLLSRRPLYSIEKIYFDSLIQYYDVYFWLGSDTFLMGADCILRNLDDFIIKRTQLVSAKKQDVLEGLGKQGLSVDNVIVLDHDAMLDTMNRLTGEIDYAMKQNSAVLVGPEGERGEYNLAPADIYFTLTQTHTHLGLEWYSDIENLHEISRVISCPEIKTVSVSVLHPDDVTKIMTTFPNLETIIILLPTLSIIKYCLPLFTHKNVELWLQLAEYSNCPVIIPKTARLKKLTLYSDTKLYFSAEPGAQIEQLKVRETGGTLWYNSDDSLEINLTNLPHLKHLELYIRHGKSQKKCNLKINPENKLTHLTVTNGQSVTLQGATTIGIEHFPCLETHNEQYTYSQLDPNKIGENKIKFLNDQLAYAKFQFVRHKKLNKKTVMISDTEKSYLLTMERHPTDRDSIQHELKEQPYLAEDRIPRNSRFLHGRSDPMPLDWETRNLTTSEIINISYKSRWQRALDYAEIDFSGHRTLKFFSIITNKSPTYIFNNCPELQYISIICHNNTKAPIVLYIRDCPKLQTFIFIDHNGGLVSYKWEPINPRFIHINTKHEKGDALLPSNNASKSFSVELPEELNINTEQQISDMELHYKNSDGPLLSQSYSSQLNLKMVLFYGIGITAMSIILYQSWQRITATDDVISARIWSHPAVTSIILCVFAYQIYNKKNPLQRLTATNISEAAKDTFYIDSDTKLNALTRQQGSSVTRIYDGETKTELHHDNFRTTIFNRFKITENKITPVTQHGRFQKINLPKPTKIEDEKKSYYELQDTTDCGEDLVYTHGQFAANQNHPLITRQAIIKKEYLLATYCNKPDLIDFYWDPVLQQCHFVINAKAPQSIILICKVKKHYNNNTQLTGAPILDIDNYLKKPPNDFFASDFINFFKKELFDRLAQNDYVNKHPVLNQLIVFLDETKPDQNRIMGLYHFCSNFHWERDLDPMPDKNNDIAIMIEIIMQYSGVCRHRSIAFALLCQLYGFDCNLVGNGDDHMYPALRFECADGSYYDKIVIINDNFPNPNPQQAPIQSIPQESAAFKRYYELFKETVSEGILSSLDQMIPVNGSETKSHAIFSPLIILKPGQNVLQVNAAILRQMTHFAMDTFENHLFINHPKDIQYLLSPGKIDENGMRALEKNGPFRKLLANKHDNTIVIVINLINFTDLEKAAYQSLIDEVPTLTCGKETFKVPPNMKFICIIDAIDNISDAFLSRIKPWIVHDDFFLPAVTQENKVSVEQEVDLFNSCAYEELLFGPINMEGKKLTHSDGPLLKAIHNNCPLTIYNPPDSDRFKQLIHQVNVEKKLLINGRMQKIPENVIIKTASRPFSTTLPKNVIITMEDSDEEQKDSLERIYLGVHNIHECEKIFIVNPLTHEAKTDLAGLLGKYQEGRHVLYIEGTLPLSAWQRLMKEISQHNKNYHFLLAPNANIESIAKNNAAEYRKANTACHISNDPDYLTEQLELEKSATDAILPLVIDVNEQSSFNNLIGEIKQTPLGFTVTESIVLQALTQGRSVILNGDISFSLYCQLLPLLSSKSHIYFNGKRIDTSAKLTLVMSCNIKNTIPNAAFSTRLFESNDYRSAFKNEKVNHDKIALFYMYAKQIAYRGTDRPPTPFISYQRIKGMLSALHNPLHKHNPVKGLFHFDYPTDSDDYAFLNVLAKAIFKPDDTMPLRNTKMQRLKTQFSIKTIGDVEKYCWHLLNCMSGAEIKEITGDDLLEIITDKHPSLPKSSLEKLAVKVLSPDRMQQLGEKEVKPLTRHEKQMNELKFYLKHKTFPIIILQGPAGVGKSHAVRQTLGENKFYEGAAGLLAWLKSYGDKPFLADEMNTQDWDFLAGIGRPNKIVVYQGIEYELTTRNHQIIGTCNPVGPRYPGRSYLKVIQNLAVTIAFKEPTDDFYKQVVLQPKLTAAFPNDHDWIIDDLITAFHFIQEYNPLVVRSIRDMENVAERFIFLAHKNNANNLNKKELVFEACACEFATSIHGYEKRQMFINQLRIKLNLPVIADETKDECHLIKITDKISLPWPKRYFIEAIEQDLEMRWQAMLKQATAGKSAKLPYYKQSIIVEGEPGSGKSVSLRALVQKHLSMLESRRQQLLLIKTSGSSSFTNEMEIELQLLTKEAAKRVEEISGGSADPQGKLTEAYHNEQLIINDEANLNREADQLISQFLCSTDENSQSVSRKGFMHLGSQNSTAHRGRKQQGTSDQNRTHFISLDDFTDAELEAFVKKNKIEHPDDFVKAYRKIKEQYPHVNMRTFHEVLKNYAKKQQTASLTNIPGITMHFNRTTPPLSTSVPIVPAKTFTV